MTGNFKHQRKLLKSIQPIKLTALANFKFASNIYSSIEYLVSVACNKISSLQANAYDDDGMLAYDE